MSSLAAQSGFISPHAQAVPPAFVAFGMVRGAQNLTDRVQEALRERIAAGSFAPRAKLPAEAALSSQFGVSRTVVREAVARLKAEGLLASRQGSGVFVQADAALRPLKIDAAAGQSQASILQIVEVRRALEAESAALAAERRTVADVDGLRRQLKALDQAVSKGGDGVAEDVAFHRLIAEASRNPHFITVLQFLGQYLQGVTRVTRANEARRSDFAAQVKAEHVAVLDAVAAQDVPRARRAAAKHMSQAARRIREADPAFWTSEVQALAATLKT